MAIKLLQDVDSLAMLDLLQPDGQLKLLSAAEYDAIDPRALEVWCHRQARYYLPTVEAIAWLKDYIGQRSAIEIGAGHGDLAHHLGIIATDSKIQADPYVQEMYQRMYQPVINYPDWVEKIDAEAAIEKYKPDIIVAAWVTQWINPNIPVSRPGSIFGIKEFRLLQSKRIYLLLGHTTVHGQKTIMNKPHRTLNLPFIRSRLADKIAGNRIFIWNESTRRN